MIYYVDGTREELAFRLVWVLDDLLGYLDTSREQLMKKSAGWMEKNSAKRVPLVVDEQCCLVPIKGRTVFSVDDGVSGYVVLAYVQSVYREDGKTVIQLARNQCVMALERERIVKQNIRLAKELVAYGKQEKVSEKGQNTADK